MDQNCDSERLFQIDHGCSRSEGKKLADAARIIAGGADGDEEVIADLKARGAPQEVIDAYQTREEDSFEVWPVHVAIVEFFLTLQSQWRRNAMNGAPLGLDYAGVAAAANWQGVTLNKEFFADLRLMEFAFIEEAMRRMK